MPNRNASITLGDGVALRIEKVIAAGRNMGEIIEAAGHTLESLVRGLTGKELVELLQSVREDLAANRLEQESTQLRKLYRIASTIVRYGVFLPEQREEMEQHLKEISRCIGPTIDDEANFGKVDTFTNEFDETGPREMDGRPAQAYHELRRSPDMPWPRRREWHDRFRLGRYIVFERLGQGGAGEVYAAHDPRVDRTVAIKVIRPDLSGDRSRRIILREARIMAKLAHPNIVQIYDVDQVDGLFFLVMELVTGTNLMRWLEETQPPWETILEKFITAGRGLAALHEAGFIHCDFKPHNVLIGLDGRARLFDFGLSRAEDDTRPTKDVPSKPETWPASGPLSELTMSGQIIGTPAYMSPEHMMAGHLDARSDQFSFCVALYEALYGRRPFHGEGFGSLRDTLLLGEVSPPPRRSNVPRQIWRILSRGLATGPSARFPTVHELLMALERVPQQQHQRKYRWAAAASFLAAGALLVSAPMLVQASSSYGPFLQVLALFFAALGGLSLGAALQRRSRLSSASAGPKGSRTPQATQGDKPNA